MSFKEEASLKEGGYCVHHSSSSDSDRVGDVARASSVECAAADRGDHISKTAGTALVGSIVFCAAAKVPYERCLRALPLRPTRHFVGSPAEQGLGRGANL